MKVVVGLKEWEEWEMMGGGGGMDGAIGVGVDGRSDGGGGGFDGAVMITRPLLSARMCGSDLAGCDR